MKNSSIPQYASPYSEREYFHLLAEAGKAIVEAKARGDDGALGELRSLMRRTGRAVGDRPTYSENRKMIELLKRLPRPRSLRGVGLKDIAVDAEGAEYQPYQRALHTQLRRFCLRAHNLWQQMGRPDKRFWWLPKYSARFGECCGFKIPLEKYLLQDSIRIGAGYCPRCKGGKGHGPRWRTETGPLQAFLFRVLARG